MTDLLSPASRLRLKITASFVELLASKGISIAVTLVPGRLVLIGTDVQGRPTVDDALLDKPWGLAVADGALVVATRRELHVYADNRRLAPHHPAAPGTFDAFYAPRASHVTGDCQVHDVWADASGLYGVNTSFSAICRFDALHSFTPVWKPPFIGALLPEDRCHLNGMAWDGGRLAYATAFGRFDTARGWRAQPPHHGVLMDCANDAILSDGLCLPHSPRVVDGQLYVTEMGAGTLLRVDRAGGRRELVAQLPGMTRGLAAIDGIAIVGLSRTRTSTTGWTLPLAARGAAGMAGLAAVELASGRVLGSAEFPAGIEEVFDLQLLPATRRAGILDLARWDGYIPVDTPDQGVWMKQDFK